MPDSKTIQSPLSEPVSGSAPEWLEVVRQKVEGLRFGIVQIVVHDAKVTQIERTEKTRLQTHRED